MTKTDCVYGTKTTSTTHWYKMVCVKCGHTFSSASKLVTICGSCDTGHFSTGGMT